MKQKKSAGPPQQEQIVACVSDLAAQAETQEMPRPPLFSVGANAEQLNRQITSSNTNGQPVVSERSSIDVEKGSIRRLHKHRPLYRRLYSYIRNAWIGARLSAKAGKIVVILWPQ